MSITGNSWFNGGGVGKIVFTEQQFTWTDLRDVGGILSEVHWRARSLIKVVSGDHIYWSRDSVIGQFQNFWNYLDFPIY